MKVIEKNDTEKLSSESTAILIVNDLIERVFNKIMTQDSKINLEPKSDIPSSSDDVTERDVRLKSSTLKSDDAAVLDTSDTDSLRCSLPLEKIDDHILQELSSSGSSSDEVQSVENSSTTTTPLKSSTSSAITTPSPTTSSTPTSTCKKRLFCLYCDRIFVSSNLRQKHVERCHSANQLRRSSSRTPGHSKLSPSCMFCGQVDNVGNDLKKLLEHLIVEHSMKYHGCLDCEERFGSKESLKIHNSSVHGIENETITIEDDEKELPQVSITNNTSTEVLPLITNTISMDTEKKKKRIRKSDIDNSVIETLPPPPQNPMIEDFEETIVANVISAAEILKQKELMEKENALKLAELEKQKTSNRNTKKGSRTNSGARNNNNNSETATSSPRTTRRSTKSSASSTPVKTKSKTNKVTAVSNPDEGNLDQIKSENSISKTETISIKVTSTSCETSSPPNYEFDENFFTCVSFNIQENLLNHLDGKLHTNNELSPMSSLHAYHQTKGSKTSETNSAYTNANGEDDDDVNNLALTALTPVTTLLTSQIGIDAYRQIEYGSKAPKHHVTRKHYVKYNFRSRKQKPSDMDISKDISKLDMWTQVAMKMRQQKIKTNLLDDEINRRTEQQVEELNRILDTRGPFQDLHEEALNSQQNDEENNSSTDEVKTVLEDILINVFDKVPSSSEGTSSAYENNPVVNLDKFISDRLKNVSNQKVLKIEDTKFDESCNRITTRSRLRNESTNERLIENETLSYFNLTRTPAASTSGTTSMSITRRTSIDMKTTTESLYKLGLDVKQMNKFLSENDHEIIVSSSVELSGEWARPRIYICGACGVKITNLKLLEDHKQFIHPHVWCAHYEFVGNQSEFYPHLNIPGLGRILENEKKEIIRNWEKSSARQCSKCQKECNTLGDLHRHMLECGGDWSWMLAKKKCKYRPFGARSRRRRVMELKRKLRVRLEGGSSSTGENTTRSVVERRRNRSKLEGPRPPRPSDADTIQRMLANLPPKRATRKIMSLKEQGLRKPNRLNPNKTNVNSNRTKQLLKSPKTNNKNETIKAANQKMKQALQRNLRSRNQLNNVKNETSSTVERKVSPRTTRRSASNSPKNEKQTPDNTNIVNNNRKTKVQKVLASKIIDSNTALGPKSKIFSRKKTRFGETVVTRLRNKILLAQKYINSDNTVRLTRSRGLHVAKQQIDEEIIKDNPDSNQKKKSTNKNDNKTTVEESEDDVPKTKRRLRSLKFLTKTLRSQKKINEVSENLQNTPSTSPARRSNRMRILSRIQRKLPSFNRRNKDKNEGQKNEKDNTPTEENSTKPSSDENIDKTSEDKTNENVETFKTVEETRKDENFDQPPVLEKITAPTKPKSNIDYCIESVVANITGQVTYKEYPRSTTVSSMEEPKKSSFSLKTFTQNMRNIGKKITNNSKNEPLNLAADAPEVSENDAAAEKIQLGKRKRVISTQTDITPSLPEEEQPPLLFPQIPIPPPLPLVPPVSALPVPIIPPVTTATIHDTISDTIEEVIAKYTVESSSDTEDDLLTKSNKKLKVNTNGIGSEKCDTIPKNLSNQNFPMPILEAVGPPNDLKRGDSIVTIPILLPVVSHVIISTGTQINSNLLEKIMDTSINNFQLNNIVPNDKTNPLLNTLSPGAGKNSEKILDSDLSGKSPVGNKEYHNYVIETPMQKLIQNGLYPVLPPNSIPNVAFDNLQVSETSGENSTQNSSTSEDTTKKDKNKSKGLKKPIKKLNDCINMLKQKLMSSSSTENSDTNPRGDILKIPTPKFNKPPIFSDPIPKKITEAPFPTTPVKKPVDISQGLDFSLPKNVPEDDQTSPIDLSCSTTSKKLFVDAPIANEVEHIIETKSIQKPPTKPKGSINFSDLPRQMELLANQNERREAERNQQQEIVSEKLITHHHPIILNVPEVVESASISNIELQKNQNEIVDVENRTKDGSEQSLVNITSLPPSSLQRLIPPSNDLVTKTLLSQNNTSIEKNSEFGSNDNIAKIPIDLSSHPIQETSSHILDVQNLINNQMTENDNKRGGRKRGTNRRIGTVRTRPIRKCNSNEEEPEVALIPRPNEDIGSDTSFEDVPLIKLVQTQESSEDIPQNLVKVTPLAPVVDNLTEIINQVAKNTINKPKDNLTEIINQVAENTINKDDSKKKIEIIPPPIIEIEKPKEVFESDLPKKLSETSQSKEQISNLMKVRKKPGRKPKSVFEPLDKTSEIPKPEQTVITEQTVIANVVIHHSTPEIKTPDMCGGNSSCITDDFDLENALPLFTVGKISPLQVSVQDPKTLMVDTIKSQLEVTTPSTSGIDTAKRPRLKPGRKPKKLLEQIENKSENVSNIVQNESILNKTESTYISSDSIPPQIIDGKPSDSLDISSNIAKTDISTENSNALTQVKKPGRKPRKQVEQIQTPVAVIENNQINQITESQIKEVQSESVPETSATLRESLADELTVESTEIDKIESVENITSSQSKKTGRKSKKGLDENKSESSSNQLENISEPSITLQSSTINETPVENTETERSETSDISDDILKEPENFPSTKDQKSNEIDSSQISETDIPEKITENLTADYSLQIKKPGRKSKKLDENKSENLNFTNDALKEPEIVLNTQDQNNSFQIIETEISKELTIENSGRKKPGRKPKKVLEEKSQSANVSNDILKESEGVLNTEDQESVQNVSSEITKLDISKELPTEITVTKDSSQLKKPGRKPKKIVDDNKLETSDVSSEILIEPKNNFNIEDQNSSQNDSSQIIESEISGKEIQIASKEFITETSTGKKKSGRKPKKVFEEKSESSNSSNDFLKEPENVLNLEDQNTINVSSEITKSDGSKELPAENAITTICSQSKKPGRKSKKIVDENKKEATDVSSDILKISEKVLNTEDQNSTQIDSQIIDVSKELLAETSTVKNSSHSKKPGRKPKNISDELETKDVSSDILKESEKVLNIEDQNSSRIDSSQKIESNISKELLTETSPENNSSQYKKPGRKHKKPVEESESPKDEDNLTDVLEKSQSVLKIEHQNSIQNDPSEITNSDISKGLTVETSITKNSSQSKKPGRKSKKIIEEDKSDNLNISGTISKEPESIFNIEDQNCTQNDSSRIMESDITNKLTTESPTATKKKPGRKQKKVIEEISQSFNTSNDNLNEPESVTHTEDKKSIKNVSSKILESDISKELTNENTSNVPDKLQNLPEHLNISTRNEISNHENLSVPFEVNTSVFKNNETGINESTENITINDSSQFKRPGRKPKKSLKQPEKDNDTSHDKLFDSEINNIPNIEEEELLKNVLNKKPGRRSRKLTVDSLEEKSESLSENVQETVITPELEQISIDIKSMPVRKSGRRSKTSSLERCQKVEKADIDVQNILDNVPVIETPQLPDENVQEIVKTAEIEQISNEFKSILVRKSGRRSKNSSLERPQKIENSDIDIHNILDIDPTIESLQLKKTNRKSKKSLAQLENKFESSIENSKETTNEFVKPNLEQNKSVEQIIENKISSDNQPKIVENKPENSKTIENILENSLEQNENNQNSIERSDNSSLIKKSGRKSKKIVGEQLENKDENIFTINSEISENSNDLSDNSYQGKNSGRKFRKIILEQTETIDNEISEDSNTSKCSTYSRKSGRKSKRIFEHVENVTEFENIEDNEFYHNSRRKSGRSSKSSLEQPHISDLSNINNSNLVLNDSLIPQVHIEPIKTSDLVENKSENLDLQSKSTEIDISNDEDIIEPTSTSSKSKRTPKKILESKLSENNLENSEPVSDFIEVDVSQDEGTSEQVASRSKSKRTSKKFLEQSKDESELEQPSEPKTTRSKLVQKSKDVEKEIDNSSIENVSTESIIQEPIITSSRITLRRKSTRLLEPVIDNSELSDPEKAASIDNSTLKLERKSKKEFKELENKPLLERSAKDNLEISKVSTSDSEDELPLAVLSKQNERVNQIDKNIEKPVNEKETINFKDSEFKEKLNEIEVVLEKIEVIPEKTRRQSAKMDKVNEIEKLLEKTKKQSAKIETDIEIEAILEKTKKQSAKPEKVNEMEVFSEKTKKQSTKPEKENKIAVLSETLKTQNAKSEKVNEIEVVPEKTKKQSTKSEKVNEIEVIPEKTKKQTAKSEKFSEIEVIPEKNKKQSANTEKINENEVIPEKIKKLSLKINKVNENEFLPEKPKKQDTKQIEFQFKEPEIRLSPVKTIKIFSHQSNVFTPGDETTDDEGDIPLAQRFGISKIGSTNSNNTETKVIEDKTNEVKKIVEETVDEDSDKTDVSSTAEENLSDKDSENKKRRGRPKKKDVISDEDYQFPRRITRRSNSSIVASSIYGSFEDVAGEIIQDQPTQITTENPVESTTNANVVLSNILVENNQNIENLEQIDNKKTDKKIEKLSIKTGEKLKTQENEFAPVDEVDAPVVTNYNEENALKSEVEKGTIIHKLKKPRKISMPPPPPPPPAPKECEENLRMRITFKKVSKLNSTIGLQLTDFENVQIITTPKADTIHSAQKSIATATPSKSVSHNPDEETDEERSLPLAERTFLQKPKLPSNTDDKNVFQFKQPGLPFSRAKRRNTIPAVFSAVDETTDEEADVPLAQRFGIKKPVFNSNAAEETEDEDRIIPLAERLEKLRKKTEIPSYKNSSAAEETEDEDRIIPLAERLAKLRQLQVAKSLHMKLPDPADETEDEDRILPLAERIARENKKQLETESLKTKINLKKLSVDPAEETEDEERIIPLAERIAKLNKAWQESEAPKPTSIAAIPNPADETEDEERIIPLALRIAKKKETVADAFQFKEPEIPELLPYQKKRKTVVPPAIFTPADETTDEEGDVPLARRFGLPKPLEENIRKRKNSLDESSSTKLEITELQSRKRRKSLSTTLDINEPSIDCTKIHVENTEKSKTIDVFDFNEPDSPVSNSLGDVRNKSKIQNIEELSNKINSKLPTKIIIETTPKKITTKLHADKQKKSSVKKIFKIRKKRRKGKLKFTNRRYKKVLSKIIIEEPEIIEHIPEIEAPIPIEESIKNTPDFESIDTIRSITPPIVENDNLEKTTENIEDDDEASRNSSLGGCDDGFDNRTDVSSLSDTTAPEPSEAVILERHSPLLLRIKTNFKAKGKRGRPPVKKISIAVDNTENYCEICNKHFCRADNLIKHKMTFTHIAKLSELEAKESEKRRLEEQQEENVEAIPTTSSGDNKENNTTPLNDNNMTDEDDDDDVFEESSNFGNDVASRDLDELAMKFIVRKNRLMDDDSIGNSDEASSSTDAFNLGNGVNYPDLVTSHQPKRYRSLGERKSFDSNQSILSPDHQLLEEQNSPQIPDSIIQEDDEDEDNESNHEIGPSTFEIPPTQEQPRPKSQNNVVFDYLKKSSDHPTSSTFEFISQTNQFEENFTRKKLNRDEELFLECCSLLKNNSKSRKIFDGRNNDLQPQSSSHHVIANSVEESTAARIDDWSNSNSVASDWLSQKGGSTTSNNNTSFNKRGQSTNVSSFKFNTMSNTAVDYVDGTVKNKPQNFEEIPFKSMALNVNEYMDFSNINVNQGSEHQKDSSKEKDDFSEINSLLSTSSETSVGRSSIHDERSLSNSTTSNEDSLNNSDDLSDFCGSKQDDSTIDSKKIPTKGALKIFEGIKVSIPTQEINLAEVLSSTQNKILQIDNQQQNIDDYDDANSKKLLSTNSNSNSVDSHSLKLYKNGVEVSQSILKTKKSSSSHIDKDDEEESTTILSTTSSAKRSANKSGTKKKITKSDKKSTVSTAKTKSTQKTKDIYDFEDSQDEFEVDQQLNFKTYRDQKLFSPNDTKDVEPPALIEANVVENNSDSDDDHHDYIDSFSVDESSHSSDEENTETTKIEPPPQQIKKAQNSVKGVKNENKKGMIMGRIFKHVVKSKTPEVGSSPNTKDANTLFDNLIGEKSNQETIPEPIAEQQQTPAPVVKKAPSANKTGKKPGKRTKPADSSSDDDFTLTRKPSKKINRRKKGNTNTKDENESGSGINLEQEIRECIGVAGRKSQRKCTSGKQNILVEFWSSDEMSDGEKRIKDSSENNVVDENNVNKENEKIEENLNNKPLSEPPTIENNPLNETIVNINDEKIEKPDNVKRKVIRNPKVAGGQGNGTTVTNAKRKPSRVQANKVSRKCSKIRNKTKARGRRKKLLPNNNNLDTQKNNHHQTTTTNSLAVTRRKRSASEKLYYWSSSSDDEFEDFIEVKPIRDDPPDDEDRPMHHGWIVGESPKKLVTMLAQAKGSKKVDAVYVKEQGKRNRVTL